MEQDSGIAVDCLVACGIERPVRDDIRLDTSLLVEDRTLSQEGDHRVNGWSLTHVRKPSFLIPERSSHEFICVSKLHSMWRLRRWGEVGGGADNSGVGGSSSSVSDPDTMQRLS